MVHTAAIAHDGESGADHIQDINVSLTTKVGAQAKHDGVPHLVFLSSFHVYGTNGRGSTIIDSTSTPSPTTPYGQSKLAAEHELNALAGDTFAVAILRPPLVYGPHCTKRNFPRFVQLASIAPFFPNVQNKRSMIYSRNLAELMRLLADDSKGGLFLPQNDELVCVADMIERLGKQMGRAIHLSNSFAKPAAFLARHNGIFAKMFGDAYYTLPSSECGYRYRIASFQESIEQSLPRL